MPIIRTDTNETYDSQGNLIHSEVVDVEVPDNQEQAIANALAILTPEQIAAMVAAITGNNG
jgi:hypothetical protein